MGELLQAFPKMGGTKKTGGARETQSHTNKLKETIAFQNENKDKGEN
jgi:hypothetical protein